MKKLLTLFLAFHGVTCMAQQAGDSTQIYLRKARLWSNGKSALFNPAKAYATYSKYAQMGNAEAMNGLGNLYNLGVGVNEDD